MTPKIAMTFFCMLPLLGSFSTKTSEYNKKWTCARTDVDETSVFTSSMVFSTLSCSAQCSETSVCHAFDVCLFSNGSSLIKCHLRTITWQGGCTETGFFLNTCQHYFNPSALTDTTIPLTTTTLPLSTTPGNPCLHKGVWDGISCTCSIGCSGQYCGSCPWRDCADGTGYSGLQIAFVTPPGMSSAVEVTCNFDSQITYLLYRRNGDENFNRDWQSYKNGFGSADSDYWIGLDNMRALTLYRTQNTIGFGMYISGSWHFDTYATAALSDEISGYVLTFQSKIGSALNPFDSTKDINGQPFRTFDNEDNGCAVSQKSGWWYNSGCADANANGPLPMTWPGKSGSVTGVRVGLY